MDFLTEAVYAANMIFALIALILFFVYLKIHREDTFHVVPRNLRLFFVTSFLPCAFIEVTCSILFSLHYFIYHDENALIFKCIRLTLGASTQHVRGTLFFIVVERIISTMSLNSYSMNSSNLSSFFILTGVTTFFTVIYGAFCVCWIFFKALLSYYNLIIYISSILHVLTVVVTKLLHSRNHRLYSLLAYRVTLRTRYQILENIKVLRYFHSTIYIFTFIAPIGVISTLIYTFIVKGIAPSSLFLLTYNLAFLLILVYQITVSLKMKRIEPLTVQSSIASTVISPLGKTLPTIVSPDNYFKDLKKQWS